MAGIAEGKTVKLRIKYDEGSQTLSQCNPEAADSALYDAAMAIADLRKDQDIAISKIIESDLMGH